MRMFECLWSCVYLLVGLGVGGVGAAVQALGRGQRLQQHRAPSARVSIIRQAHHNQNNAPRTSAIGWRDALYVWDGSLSL